MRLRSWEEYLSIISDSPYQHWAFRGQRDASAPLYSALSRYFMSFRIDRRAWRDQEERILRVFKRKAIHFLDHVPDKEDDFEWLALMQDHGAPTRLLDFSWSPYVAAFFALHNTTEDGVIWACNPVEIERRSMGNDCEDMEERLSGAQTERAIHPGKSSSRPQLTPGAPPCRRRLHHARRTRTGRRLPVRIVSGPSPPRMQVAFSTERGIK